jgi:hypothetical protein
VTLDVVNEKCSNHQCMSSSSIAAQYIAECKRQDKCASDYPIYSVTGSSAHTCIVAVLIVLS